MDIFESISGSVTLFLVNHKIISEKNGGTFDYIFGRVFFFIITFTLYMAMCMVFVSPLNAFVTIMAFNLSYNLANKNTRFHAIKMQNCALVSGLSILIALLASMSLQNIIVFKFSFIIYNLIISFIISKCIVSTKGRLIFRWIENKILLTEIK